MKNIFLSILCVICTVFTSHTNPEFNILNKNPQVRVLTKQIEAARHEYQLARKQSNPELELEYNKTENQWKKWSLSQDLNSFHSKNTELQKKKLNENILEMQLKLLKINLYFEMHTLLSEIRLYHELDLVIEKEMDFRTRRLNLFTGLFNKGEKKAGKVLDARDDLNKVKLAHLDLIEKQYAAKVELAHLLGMESIEQLNFNDFAHPEIKTQAGDPRHWLPVTILRMGKRKYELDKKAAKGKVMKGTEFSLDYSDPKGDKEWIFSVAFPLPIFEKDKHHKKSAQLHLDILSLKEEKLISDLKMKHNLTIHAYELSKKKIQILQDEVLSMHRKNLEEQRLRFKENKVSYDAVLDAKIEACQAEKRLKKMELERERLKVGLFYYWLCAQTAQ